MNEHSEVCGCAECVTEYSACGQTDPYGFNVSVSWELGSVTNAEWFPPEDYKVSAEERSEMDALVARIDGRRFASADDLVAYLRRVTGSRDFD
jgi:hypothetical protein